MRCSEFNDAVARYLEGAMSQAEKATFDAHRSNCPECQDHLDKCQELTCRELLDFLCDYVEDDLAPESRRIFDRHLEICPECVDYVDGYRKTVALGRAAFERDDVETSLPKEIPDQLVQAILDARRAESAESAGGPEAEPEAEMDE